jgi:multicomponent Na+:H+ antiporter subunit B
MRSLILQTAIRFLLPLLLLFSIFLLLRGHNEPGGGFAGGLVAASAFALYSISFDAAAARKVLRIEPNTLVSVGLLLALLSSLVALIGGQPLLTGIWGYMYLPGLGPFEIGTPVTFEIGVYLLVTGVTLMFVFALEEA